MKKACQTGTLSNPRSLLIPRYNYYYTITIIDIIILPQGELRNSLFACLRPEHLPVPIWSEISTNCFGTALTKSIVQGRVDGSEHINNLGQTSNSNRSKRGKPICRSGFQRTQLPSNTVLPMPQCPTSDHPKNQVTFS